MKYLLLVLSSIMLIQSNKAAEGAISFDQKIRNAKSAPREQLLNETNDIENYVKEVDVENISSEVREYLNNISDELYAKTIAYKIDTGKLFMQSNESMELECLLERITKANLMLRTKLQKLKQVDEDQPGS
ncbi:MAG: hypothetical protein P4L22_00995 [Candidatus Babeliales bacterium]|nr:hypothetical protein [Candidatus Babeliales bacterium]